jgi:hypothetical protein
MQNSTRKLLENSDFPQGIVAFHNIGGGTGSGLLTRYLELVRNDLNKKAIITASLSPSPNTQNEVISPYNAVFALRYM